MRRLLASVLLIGCSEDAPASPPPPSDTGVDTFVESDASPDAATDTNVCVSARDVVDPAKARELTVTGDMGSTRGIFDPSIFYPSDAPVGVMAYSSVPSQDSIFTRIALSNDKGATWNYVADVNATLDIAAESSECPGGTCAGRLIHEVSSLAVDPTDEASRRFKLFVHTYFAYPGTDPVKLRYDWGHIALYTAERPEGPWSAPQRLLGWTSTMPYASSVDAAQLLTAVPELSKCVAFTEPGAVATGTTIELTLGCVELATPTPTIRVVLLRSTDHAKTFKYVSTLLRPEEASCVSSVPQLNAAHLFGAKGKVYVAASTAGTVSGGFSGYNGCVVYEIDDLVKGTIKPGIVRQIVAAGDRFSGACSYADQTGYVLSMLRLESAPRTFQMFNTGSTTP